MIQLRSVRVTYAASGAEPLRDVSAELAPGSIAITGPSGSGKSTLLRVVAGHQVPDEGHVLIGQSPVVARSRSNAGDPRVAMVHQDYRLVSFLSVAENLQLALDLRGQQALPGDLDAALAQVGLQGYGDRFPTTLSGGEQQRVAIARALITRPTVLLADEPTGALDAQNSLQVAQILAELGADGERCVVVATHDPYVADTMPRRARLVDGRLSLEHPAAAE